ncbi:uncharacterized protein [Ptychodera flava]|uniref:uncharacterized protein isoform X1 n=1 Tax=Ptychodera flava TaxID=63121 RepID=UPI00396AAB08
MTASISELPAAISCTGGSQTQTELMITQAQLKRLEEENRLLAESNSKESYRPAVSNSNSSKKSSEKQKREDILKECTDFVGDNLSVKDWKRLARKLGVSDSDIEIIEYEHRGDVREMIHTMLSKWKREHKDATTATLIKGLESIRLNRLAHDVRTKFPTDTSSDEPPGRESQEGRMSGNFEAAGDSLSNIPHDEPEVLFTNEFLEDLERLNFNQDDIIVVVKKLKLTGDKQMELHKTSNPLNVACVSKVWESMTRPMQQDEETQCRLIRSFVRVMRDIKRNDIVKVLKEHIPRGVGKIGTQLAEKQPLQNIPFSIRTQLVNLLSIPRADGMDWRKLAEDINIPNANTFIKLWEQRPTPGELVLHTWQSRADATVGNLYKLLVNNGMNDSAALLE